MKAIIIEDEKPSARRLSRMLENLGVEIISTLHSVENAVNWFSTNSHPDIIFLDIQLNDGLSFEIFNALEVNSAIIFTTAYDEYALQAFKLNSIDYLLKPIDEEELKTAVQKYQSFFKDKVGDNLFRKAQIDFEEIKQLLVNPLDRKFRKRFTVKIGQHLKMIPVEEIECFYSENKGTYLFSAEGRNYPLECTLENLGEELPPEDFFRVNRKFYVNLHYIQDIITYSNSRLKVKLKNYTEQEIIVAREKVKEFRDWLE